jgi:GNAT superfamily N-acetyltransferase
VPSTYSEISQKIATILPPLVNLSLCVIKTKHQVVGKSFDMPNVVISAAEISEAEALKDISTSAFKNNFEKYGHYPPGIESLEWHQDKIINEIYYKIQYDRRIVGGVYLSLHPTNEMKIEFIFLSPDFHGKKIGTKVMSLIEKKHNEIRKWFLLTPYKDFHNHRFYEKFGYLKIGEIKPDENSNFKLFQYEKKK